MSDSRPPSPKSPPESPSGLEPAPEEDWAASPGGPALSSGGQVVQAPPTARQAPVPTPCAHCHAPLPSAGARCARCGQEQAPRITPLGRDMSPLELDPRPESSPPPWEQPLDTRREAPLELAERAPRSVDTYVPVDMRRPLSRRLLALARTLLLLALVGGALWLVRRYAGPSLGPLVAQLRGAAGVPAPVSMLSFTSTPPGATVSVEGQVVGTTPLFLDNTWPERPISVRMTLKGYKPWTGTFLGQQAAALDVTLKR